MDESLYSYFGYNSQFNNNVDNNAYSNNYTNYQNPNVTYIPNLYFPDPVITAQTPSPSLQNQNKVFENQNVITQPMYSNYINSNENVSVIYPNNNYNNNNYYLISTNKPNIKQITPNNFNVKTKLTNPPVKIDTNTNIINYDYFYNTQPIISNTTINNADLISKPGYQVLSEPINNTHIFFPQQLNNVKQKININRYVNNTGIIENNNSNNSNIKIIQMPNYVKKDNIFTSPYKNIGQRIEMPPSPDNTNINKIKVEDYNSKSAIFQSPVKTISNNEKEMKTPNNQVIINNQTILEENKKKTNIDQNKAIENLPANNPNEKVIEEITYLENNVEIVPTNNVKNRPL